MREGLRVETARPDNQFIMTVSTRSSYEDARMFSGHGGKTHHPISVNIGALAGNGLNLGAELAGHHPLNVQQVLPAGLAPVGVNIPHPILGNLPGQPALPEVQDGPAITNFYTVFPDEPTLQRWNQSLAS